MGCQNTTYFIDALSSTKPKNPFEREAEHQRTRDIQALGEEPRRGELTHNPRQGREADAAWG